MDSKWLRIVVLVICLLALSGAKKGKGGGGTRCGKQNKGVCVPASQCNYPCAFSKCPGGSVCCFPNKKKQKKGCLKPDQDEDEKPGQCPAITFITSDCTFCKRDGDCEGAEKCCGGCCNGHVLEEKPGKCPVSFKRKKCDRCSNDEMCEGMQKCCDKCCVEPQECFDRHNNIKGKCMDPEQCKKLGLLLDWTIFCPDSKGKKCVCCVDRRTTTKKTRTTTTTPSTPRPTDRPGKCPAGPRPNYCQEQGLGCGHDYQCGPMEKCCHGCCARIVECEDKHKQIKGKCMSPYDCARLRYIAYRDIYCPDSHGKKCVCCVKPRTTTPQPTTTETTTKPTTTQPRPTDRPGKCPGTSKPNYCKNSRFWCRYDDQCRPMEKCCDGCCRPMVECEDKHRQIKGKCMSPYDCDRMGSGYIAYTDIPCPYLHGRKCVCCVKRKTTTPQPTTTEARPTDRPGKCPNTPRPDYCKDRRFWCRYDDQCRPMEKCCGGCCRRMVECEDKSAGIKGKCMSPYECARLGYIAYTYIYCPDSHGQKCVCCVKERPTTTPPPTTTPTTTPTERPGKCPRYNKPPPCYVYCHYDQDCKSGFKCCNGCCRPIVECKDPKKGINGHCMTPYDCDKLDLVKYWDIYCPTDPGTGKSCVCCAERQTTTSEPTTTSIPPPTNKPGKCPESNSQKHQCQRSCRYDRDCLYSQICCDGCCVDPVDCSDPDRGIYGLCMVQNDCYKLGYNIYPNIYCPPHHGRKCVCCSKDKPKTTTMKEVWPTTCLAELAGRFWRGKCIDKHLCKKGNQYSFNCKGVKTCHGNQVCCFTKNTKPNINACR